MSTETLISDSDVVAPMPPPTDYSEGVTPPQHVAQSLGGALAISEELRGLDAQLEIPGQELVTETMRELPSAERALLQVEERLEEQVAELGPKLCTNYQSEDYQEILAREQAFFTEIYTKVLTMAEHHDGPIAPLFDIDYTIVHHDAALARPALPLVIAALNQELGDRLQVGLLTTRAKFGEQGLVNELANPTYTRDIRSKINPDFVISSGDLDRPGHAERSLVDSNDTAAKIAATQAVLDPKLIEAVEAGRVDIDSFYDSKLIVLQRLLLSHPDTSFVMVDDLPLAAAIRRDSSRIAGIQVDQEILDKNRRPFNTVPATETLQAAESIAA